jgi:hypothetical protein
MAEPTPLGIGGLVADTKSNLRTSNTPLALRHRTLRNRAVAASVLSFAMHPVA